MGKMKLLVIVLVVVILMMGVACTSAVPLEKEKVVKVGINAAFTGVVADASVPLSWGALDYLAYVNEEMGGIEGVKLNVKWEETSYDVPRNIMAYKRFRARGVVALMTLSSPATEALAATASRDKLPILCQMTLFPAAYRTKPIYAIGMFSDYAGHYTAWAKWTVQNWTETRSPRVGLLFGDVGQGWLHMEPEVTDYISKLGIEFVGWEVLPLGLTDASIEIKRLIAKNPDFVYIVHATGQTGVIMRDVVRVGVKGKAKWASFMYGLDTCLRGLAPEQMEGVYITWVYALPDDDLPGVRLAKDLVHKYGHGEVYGNNYIQGLVTAMTLVEGLRLALEKVGYENYDQMTGADVREGLLSVTNLDVGGLAPVITITPDYPVGNRFVRICVAEKTKKATWVSDWLESPDIFKAARN